MLTFVLDEHYRGLLAKAVGRHNALGRGHAIDFVCVGDLPDLPLGTQDPDLLIWGELNGRLIVTEDKGTMPTHFHSHLAAGRHSPGVLLVRLGTPMARLVAELELIAHVGDPADFWDQYQFIPL
jgi:hypothetical protein